MDLDDVRVAVTECGTELMNAQKISIPPDSLKVIDLLTEHHLLKGRHPSQLQYNLCIKNFRIGLLQNIFLISRLPCMKKTKAKLLNICNSNSSIGLLGKSNFALCRPIEAPL